MIPTESSLGHTPSPAREQPASQNADGAPSSDTQAPLASIPGPETAFANLVLSADTAEEPVAETSGVSHQEDTSLLRTPQTGSVEQLSTQPETKTLEPIVALADVLAPPEQSEPDNIVSVDASALNQPHAPLQTAVFAPPTQTISTAKQWPKSEEPAATSKDGKAPKIDAHSAPATPAIANVTPSLVTPLHQEVADLATKSAAPAVQDALRPTLPRMIETGEAPQPQPSTLPAIPQATPVAAAPSGFELTTIDQFEFVPRTTPEIAAAKGDLGKAQAAPSLDARVITGQVAVAIVKAESGKLDIRLDPPELGRLSVTLTTENDTVNAVVAADKADTQDLLRRHADMLQRALREAGYSEVTLEFSTSAESDQGNAGHGETAPPGEMGDRHNAEPATYALKTASSGLDIRL